jgi:pimeloyl-ACP methyl ester carboxylesterase
MTGHGTSLANCTSGRCQANGIDIHFLRTGGDKPPLVALHGLIGSGACLSPLARTLEADFDVILPDARGHGRSSAPANGYSYPELAADVIGLIKKLDLDAPILLGHSMGGLTAAVVASLLESVISGLVLVDPTFISPERQREAFESDVAAEHGQLLTLARSDLLARARQRSPNRSAEMIEHLVDARIQTSIDAFEVLTPPNPDYRELVRLVRVPTLLVIGEKGVVSLDTAKELQRLNPLVCPELIADIGHGLPYDEPSRLGGVVLSFLRRLAPFGNETALVSRIRSSP